MLIMILRFSSREENIRARARPHLHPLRLLHLDVGERGRMEELISMHLERPQVILILEERERPREALESTWEAVEK